MLGVFGRFDNGKLIQNEFDHEMAGLGQSGS
jgi:hypothetical protein